MVTAIQIFGVLLVLFNFFVLFMCAKRWRIVHVLATFLVFASAIPFVMLASASLKTNLAWKKQVQLREKELEAEQKKELAIKYGDSETKTEDTETYLIGAKAAVEREQFDRGRIWNGCVVARADAGAITVNTYTPEAGAAADAPVRANHMTEKMILFAFKEKEAQTGDGFRVPYEYLGEFQATAVTETTVTLTPTLPLDAKQIAEINANTPNTSWVLYEVMPIDSHEAYFDPRTKSSSNPFGKHYDRKTLEFILGTDEKRVVDNYAYDLMPVNDIEKLDKAFVMEIPPERIWIKVKFLKAYQVEVDSTDAAAVDKTLFDSSGRALPLSLRQGDKSSFKIGDFALFDPVSAAQLITDGTCDKVGEVFVRALQNYEQHFHDIDKRLKQVADNSAIYTVDTANLQASKVAAQKQSDYRLKERDNLASDLKNVLYEKGEVTAYRASLELALAKKRAELSELYRTNNLLAAQLAAIQKKIADELNAAEPPAEPTGQSELETISIGSP